MVAASSVRSFSFVYDETTPSWEEKGQSVLKNRHHDRVAVDVDGKASVVEDYDGFSLAHENLMDKEEEEEDGIWWAFALALFFACASVHVWSQAFLSYLAWYPTFAFACLVSLVVFSGFLYRYLEDDGEDEAEEECDDNNNNNDRYNHKASSGRQGTSTHRELVRAAMAICAKQAQLELDLMSSCSDSEDGSSCPSLDVDESCANIALPIPRSHPCKNDSSVTATTTNRVSPLETITVTTTQSNHKKRYLSKKQKCVRLMYRYSSIRAHNRNIDSMKKRPKVYGIPEEKFVN